MDTLTVSDLCRQVEELGQRIERLETELASVRKLALHGGTVSEKGAADQAKAPKPLPADVVLAISAAVAAYLGKRAVIRQIRFSGDTAWARHGRMAVQSSHDPLHGFR